VEFLLIRVLSPRTERATMWRHDETKDFTNVLFATSDAAYFLKTDIPEPMAPQPWEYFTAFFCSEAGALCRYLEMPKNNISELVSITHLLRQTSLEFGKCKNDPV